MSVLPIAPYLPNEVLQTAKNNLRETQNLYNRLRPNGKILKDVGLGTGLGVDGLVQKIAFYQGIIELFEPSSEPEKPKLRDNSAARRIAIETVAIHRSKVADKEGEIENPKDLSDFTVEDALNGFKTISSQINPK